MSIEEFRKNIELALIITQNVPEQFKLKAFEVTLTKLLNGTSNASMGLSSSFLGNNEQANDAHKNMEDLINKLAQSGGITASQLKDVFQFEETRPLFIGRINGTEALKQVQITKLYLLVSKEVYGQDWVETSILNEVLRSYGVSSLNNLAENLKTIENEIRVMGQGRGRKYRLTEPGRQVAIESLKQLCTS